MTSENKLDKTQKTIQRLTLFWAFAMAFTPIVILVLTGIGYLLIKIGVPHHGVSSVGRVGFKILMIVIFWSITLPNRITWFLRAKAMKEKPTTVAWVVWGVLTSLMICSGIVLAYLLFRY